MCWHGGRDGSVHAGLAYALLREMNCFAWLATSRLCTCQHWYRCARFVHCDLDQSDQLQGALQQTSGAQNQAQSLADREGETTSVITLSEICQMQLVWRQQWAAIGELEPSGNLGLSRLGNWKA